MSKIDYIFKILKYDCRIGVFNEEHQNITEIPDTSMNSPGNVDLISFRPL